MTIQTFDQCLSALMKKHRITISDMTRRLSIRSNTTLSRILHAQSSVQAAEHFFQALQSVTPPVFDAAEFMALERALEVSRLGVDAYNANMEMWRLLGSEPLPSNSFPIESYGSARYTSTEQLIDFYKTVHAATIHIASSLVYPVFPEMRDLLIDIAPSRRVQVHHYFSLEGDDSQIIRAVRTALPVVCLPNYHGYKMSRPSTLDREFLSQSHAVARFQRADGSFGTHAIVFIANRCLLYENNERSGIFEMLVRRIAEQGRWYAPVKEDRAASQRTDLLLEAKNAFLREKDRALYGITPDIPLAAIPGDLVDVLTRDPWAPPMSAETLAELKWVQYQRNRNLYEKKSPSHFIVQREGLRRFAETGELALVNRPGDLSPFSPAERVAILTDCLRRTQEMHCFKLHLAKGPLAACNPLYILCLDRLGVQFRHPKNAAQGAPVVALTEFTALYQRFFTEELLAKHVERDDVLCGFLRGLIDELKRRL